MGMKTEGTITINAPAGTVFSWLTDPKKVTQWLGGAGGLPEDPAKLVVGYTADAAPGMRLTVTNCLPPHRLEFTIDYPGGTSVTTYSLVERAGGVTTLATTGDTDYGTLNTSGADTQLENQPALLRGFVHLELLVVNQLLKHGKFDALGEPGVQAGLDANLTKLKKLVES